MSKAHPWLSPCTHREQPHLVLLRLHEDVNGGALEEAPVDLQHVGEGGVGGGVGGQDPAEGGGQAALPHQVVVGHAGAPQGGLEELEKRKGWMVRDCKSL